MAEPLIERRARGSILTALGDRRVVLVLGARQVGKSTLCASIAAEDHPAATFTLDDRATREAASDDPTGFVAGLPERVVIDEIDEHGRVPGRRDHRVARCRRSDDLDRP